MIIRVVSAETVKSLARNLTLILIRHLRVLHGKTKRCDVARCGIARFGTTLCLFRFLQKPKPYPWFRKHHAIGTPPPPGDLSLISSPGLWDTKRQQKLHWCLDRNAESEWWGYNNNNNNTKYKKINLCHCAADIQKIL